MTDEQKQKRRDYQREYYKKYYAAKKLNNKIIDDSDNENDFNNHKIFKCVLVSIKQKENNFCLCISSVKWGHLENLEPNSTNTIFSTNPMGSSSPL